MGSEDTKKEDKEAQEDLEKRIKEAIRITKEQIEEAEAVSEKANDLKITTYWDTGHRIRELTVDMPAKECKAIVERFVADTGMSMPFYYLAMQFTRNFTKEQYEKAKENGMSVRVMKALAGDKKLDDKRRAQLIHQAITKGLTEEDIRILRGSKGARTAATVKQREAKVKKQPPRRVFSTALDRAMLLEETVGFATDAVGRMSKLDDKELAETTKVLVQLRDKIDDVDKVIGSFLKFTSNVSKKKKD
jgi:hypothetical protein